MMPMPQMLQMQLLQQQMMGGGMGCYDGFDDDMYDMMDPSLLYWLEAYANGFGDGRVHGHINGFDQASQYYQMMQQMQMAQRMQMMMPYHGHGMRYPRRKARLARLRMNGGLGMGIGMRGMIGGGVGIGGRGLMGSPYGVGGGQLALMNSPWGGG